MAMSVADRVYTEEDVRCFRLSALIVNLGTAAARNLFNKEVQNIHGSLSAALNDPAAKNMMNNFLYPPQSRSGKQTPKLLNQTQYDALYPTSNLPTSEDFDITLLMFLFRNLLKFKPPPRTGNWNDDPHSQDFSTSAYLVRLKNMRNTAYGHIKKTQITLTQFQQHWAEMECIIKHLDNTLASDIDRFKHEEISQSQDEKYKILIMESYINDLQNTNNLVTEKTETLGNLVTKQHETLSNVVTEKTETLGNLVIGQHGHLGNLVTEKTENVGNLVTEKTKTLGNLVTKKTEAVGNLVTKKTETMVNLVTKQHDTLSNLVTEKTETVGNLVTKQHETLGNLVTEKTETLGNLVTKQHETLSNVVTEKTETLGNQVTKNTETVGNLVTTLEKLSVKMNAVTDKDDAGPMAITYRNDRIITSVKEGLDETDRPLEPLESFMQHLPDHMPIPLLSLAGKCDPAEINQLLQNGFRVFRFNQHDDLTAVIKEIDKYIQKHKSESVLVWPSENSTDLNQLQFIDFTKHKTVEDIRGKTLLLAVNGNSLGDKVAAFEIPQGEKDIKRIQKHFSQCATYENFHGSDNKTVITVTDDKNDVIRYFARDRKHVTCGIVVVNHAASDIDTNKASDIVNINSRYPEMVKLIINNNHMLKDVNIRIGEVDKDRNHYQIALGHKIIGRYMEFHITDYAKFIDELSDCGVLDSYQAAKLEQEIEKSRQYPTKYTTKLHVLKTIKYLQGSLKKNWEGLKLFIGVLKSHTELQPLAYFLLEWIAKCKMEKEKEQTKSGNSPGNSMIVKVKELPPGCDEKKVREMIQNDPSAFGKLFGNVAEEGNVNIGCIEFQINVSSEEELLIRDMIKNKEFEKNFFSWLKEKGMDVKEDAEIETHFFKVGERHVLQVKEEMPSIKKAESIAEWLRQLCVYIANCGISEWRELGQHLGISEEELDDLSVEFSDNSDRCLLMLVDWNEDENSTATDRDKITSLSQSLETCGQKDMADKIKDELREHDFSDMSLDDTPGKDSFQNMVEFTVKTFLETILNQHVIQTWGSELKLLLQDISAGALVELSPKKEDLLKFQDYIYNNEKITLLAQEKQLLKQGNVDEFDIQLLYKLLKISEISGIKTSHARWLDIQKGNIADMLHPEKFAGQNKKEQDLIHIQQLTSWVTLIVRYADEIAPEIQHVYNESQEETHAFIQALEYLTQYYESLKLTDSSTDFQQIEGNSDIEYRTQQEVVGEELSASNFLQPHAGSSEKNVEFPERFNPEFRFLKVQEQDNVFHQMHQLIQQLQLILSEKKVEMQHSIMVHSVDLPKQVTRSMQERSESATRSVKSFRFTHVDLKSLGTGEKKVTYYSEFPIKHDCFRICYVNHIVKHSIYIPYPHDDIKLNTIKGPQVLQPLQLSMARLVLAAGNGLFEVNCEGRVMCQIMKGKFRDVHVSGNLMAVIEHYTEKSNMNDRIHILSTTAPYTQSAVIPLKFRGAETVLLSENASTVYVSDSVDHITTYSLSVKPISDEPISRWERVPTGELFGARLSATDSSGHVLICDEFNNRLQLLSAGGEWMVLPGVHVSRPRDAFILDDILYVLDNCHKISMFKIE